MSGFTMRIWDEDGDIKAEGRLDDADDLDRPPTPTVIIASYLGANTEQVFKQAMAWFDDLCKRAHQADAQPQIAESRPKLILPSGAGEIEGTPV